MSCVTLLWNITVLRTARETGLSEGWALPLREA